nr:helix-turn-helix transcriptional regulator [Ensifer sp. IC4062]
MVALLIEKRKIAGLTQDDLAKAVGEHQSFIARLESGQRRIDVIEYVTLAQVIGFDPIEALKQLVSKVEQESML